MDDGLFTVFEGWRHSSMEKSNILLADFRTANYIDMGIDTEKHSSNLVELPPEFTILYDELRSLAASSVQLKLKVKELTRENEMLKMNNIEESLASMLSTAKSDISTRPSDTDSNDIWAKMIQSSLVRIHDLEDIVTDLRDRLQHRDMCLSVYRQLSSVGVEESSQNGIVDSSMHLDLIFDKCFDVCCQTDCNVSESNCQAVDGDWRQPSANVEIQCMISYVSTDAAVQALAPSSETACQADDEVTSYTEELAALTSLVDMLDSDRDKKEKIVCELESKIAASASRTREIGDLEADRQSLIQVLSSLKMERSSLNDAISILRAKFENESSSLRDIAAKLNEVKSQEESTRKNVLSMMNERDDLEENIAEIRRNVRVNAFCFMFRLVTSLLRRKHGWIR